ncbi:hypothetical protein E1176_06925 [Fulvivirga sp. RKSG066]|uniref:hypothetical protein n=1 Tax=Fulvivirga aurantia TaxID=2529383 RepID=UPI0012BB4ED2|nr:hypothetical protein [Fulvivirga aurantia]MTI20748.1 hypothetical protein [Fulvivirga aurantia]
MTRLIVFLYLLLISSTAIAQNFTQKEKEKIKQEIEQLSAAEQNAFEIGECEKVADFFDEDVVFYAAGRKAPSVQFIQNFCSRIPRPFEKAGEITEDIYVMSPSVVHTIKVIELAEKKQREVVTKIWHKTTDGWKIIHFHSSINQL